VGVVSNAHYARLFNGYVEISFCDGGRRAYHSLGNVIIRHKRFLSEVRTDQRWKKIQEPPNWLKKYKPLLSILMHTKLQVM
jgi:hypothetical protein